MITNTHTHMKETRVQGCTTPKVISQGLILHTTDICSINGISAQLNTIHDAAEFCEPCHSYNL